MTTTDTCNLDADSISENDVSPLDPLIFSTLDHWLDTSSEFNGGPIDLLGIESEVKTEKRSHEDMYEAELAPTLEHVSESISTMKTPKGYISAFNFFSKCKRAELLLRSEYSEVWDFSVVSFSYR